MRTGLLRNVSSIGSQVVGAVVTTFTLSFGFMIFNDYVAPPPDLTGRWKFTVTYKDTSYAPYKNLKVTYQVLLIQDGLKLSGTGEKLSDRGPKQNAKDYDGAERTNIDVVGSVTRNYFLPETAVLHYSEMGLRRETSTVNRLVQCGPETMCGCFQTTIADTSGPVWWQRGPRRDNIYEPVEQLESCGHTECSSTTC